MSEGIIISDNIRGKSLGNVTYNTSNKHLILNVNAQPKHLDVFDTVPGTALALAGGLNEYHEEILLTINHGLGFKPTVLMYFYVLADTADITQNNRYGADQYFFSGSAGTFADILTHREDANKVELFHYVQDYGFNTIWTSPAPNFTMRIKYFVFSNPVDQVLP